MSDTHERLGAAELPHWRDTVATHSRRVRSGADNLWWYREAMMGAGVYLNWGRKLPMHAAIEVALAYWMAENCK